MTCNFSEVATLTDNSPVGAAKMQEGEEGATKNSTPAGNKRAQEGLQKNTEPPIVYVGPDLPLVLIDINYVANLMRFPVVNTPHQHGCERDGTKSHPIHNNIAGRLRLFTPNWQVITQDPWVMNCFVQGYTID